MTIKHIESHAPQSGFRGIGLIQSSPEGVRVGEVVVAVKLTNTSDLALARHGHIDSEAVRRIEIQAIVDTGAVNCVLPASVADQLGLARLFKRSAQYADGRYEEVDVTEPVLFEMMGREVFEECLVLGDEVLIGQTALESTDLFVDCRGQRLVPNPAHPNQPVIRVR